MNAATTPAPAREVTEWFPAEVKPVHVGVYHVRYQSSLPGGGHSYWAAWDGKSWTPAVDEIELVEPAEIGGIQEKEWRGLKVAA